MAVVSITTLKTYFETGDFPTEQQFINLIDTLTPMNIHKTTLTKDQIVGLGSSPTIEVLAAAASGTVNQVFAIQHEYVRAGAPNFSGSVSLSYREDGLSQDLFSDAATMLFGASSDIEGISNQKGSSDYIEISGALKVRAQGAITGGNASSTLIVSVFYKNITVDV